MRTIRRVYFYLLSLISIEVILWGSVNLLRTLISTSALSASKNLLATGLALVLVGIPVFLIHWLTVQHESQRDEEEHASRIRAIFLYAILATLFTAMTYATLALINRALLPLIHELPTQALFGGQQSNADNLIALVANLILFLYFGNELNRDWQVNPAGHFLNETRRLFRYLWMLAGLTMLVAGLQGILHFIFYIPQPGVKNITQVILMNGLSALLVGTPLWIFFWLRVQRSLSAPAERQSLLRLGVLYLITLIAIIAVLSSSGIVLANIIYLLLTGSWNWVEFLNEHRGPLAMALTLGVVWLYYNRVLTAEVSALADEPRRLGLRRLYASILSFLGLACVFFGAQQVFSFIIQTADPQTILSEPFKRQISNALALLAVGLPVWLKTWPGLQKEAAALDEAGDHARRSTIRKFYLYLILFMCVVGAMATAGWAVYILLQSILGTAEAGWGQQLAQRLQTLALVSILLVYHLRALLRDGKLAQHALAEKQAAFTAYILLPESENELGRDLIHAIQRQTPRLSAQCLWLEKELPPSSESPAHILLLPAALALTPTEALSAWLAAWKGPKVLLPLPLAGWTWLGSPNRSRRDLAAEAALAVRLLAEGQPVRPAGSSNPWVTVGYILAGLFGVQLLFVAFSLVMSIFESGR